MTLLNQFKNKVFWKLLFPVLRPFVNAQKTFSLIYSHRLWGPHQSISGKGSEISNTRNCLKTLEFIFEKYQIDSLLDVPCGDFSWLSELVIKDNINYTGLDIVQDLINENTKRYQLNNINFRCHDAIHEKLPDADLIFCRDLLFHLSFADINRFFLNIISSNSKYLLVTSHCVLGPVSFNHDIQSGFFRYLSLTSDPLNLPVPTSIHFDYQLTDEVVNSLFLYDISELRKHFLK